MNTIEQEKQNEIGSRDENGRWEKGNSGNPKGRPPNSEAIRKLLEPSKTELVGKAIELALAGDTTALKICLDRLAAPLKPEGSIVEIEGLDKAVSLVDKANLIVQSVASGLISIEIAEKLLNTIQIYSKVVEVHDLELRIAQLESKKSR